jgi:hypothetical protein
LGLGTNYTKIVKEQTDPKKYIYKWEEKLDTGEYLYEWNNYSPHYAGCMYGSSNCLGGEEKFYQCYDFFSGIGDVSWWIKEELDKLTKEEQDELLYILKRNKSFDDYIHKIIPELAKLLNVKTYQIYRIGNKKIYDFLNLIHAQSDSKDDLKKNYYEEE